ncbi:MAG: hypothetical protein N2652_01870 [Kiritimatiellae bacterium]|nr:hypothetical protein [Kiritimatiellia bacterium]
MMLRCKWYRWRWSARRDAAQPMDRATARHLELCAACRDAVQAMEQLDRALARGAPAVEVPASEAAEIWRAVAGAGQQPRVRRDAFAPACWRWVWVALGAAAVVLVLHLAQLGRTVAPPEVSQIGLAAAGELAGWAGRIGEWTDQPGAELGRALSGAVQPWIEDARRSLTEFPVLPANETL